jgi:hypothetical protein
MSTRLLMLETTRPAPCRRGTSVPDPAAESGGHHIAPAILVARGVLHSPAACHGANRISRQVWGQRDAGLQAPRPMEAAPRPRRAPAPKPGTRGACREAGRNVPPDSVGCPHCAGPVADPDGRPVRGGSAARGEPRRPGVVSCGDEPSCSRRGASTRGSRTGRLRPIARSASSSRFPPRVTGHPRAGRPSYPSPTSGRPRAL